METVSTVNYANEVSCMLLFEIKMMNLHKCIPLLVYIHAASHHHHRAAHIANIYLNLSVSRDG